MTDFESLRIRPTHFLRWIYFVCIFAFVVRASAQTDVMKHENVQRGQADFRQSCAICHGTEAMGGVGPNLVESSLVRHDENGNLIAPVIQDGRPDKGMPAFPLIDSAEISDIVAFLHARVADGQRGVVRRPGRWIFAAAVAHRECRSRQAIFLWSREVLDLSLAHRRSGWDCEEIFARRFGITVPCIRRTILSSATVDLNSGKQFEGKLLHLDAFYVAILDQDGWYRSWPLQQAKVQVHDPLAGHLELLSKYTDKDIHDVFAYLETLK